MKIIGASIGDCVHIQGIFNFLKTASDSGHETKFLGPAVSVDQLIAVIKQESPDAVAVSYRLTPENAEHTLTELKQKSEAAGIDSIDYLFGGTPPVAEVARQSGIFSLVCDGNNQDVITEYLSDEKQSDTLGYIPPQDIRKRIDWKNPSPVLRTHFGLPNLEKTIYGIEQIANSGLIDVISLGTDQDAQANFFHPEKQNESSIGAGGVPVRSADDFEALFGATRRGNYPIMRTYAGTDDLIKLAELYEESFGNAWAAVPIFWFNAMDRRGPHSLERSISEHIDLIKWNAKRDIPVEILEAHHWAMRWGHDSLVVASAVLGASIAKGCGVNNYIHQYMFNVPPESSFTNELAKMLATKELIDRIADDNFRVYTQTRTGLPSFPNNLEEARAQLANSTMLQMQLSPDIIHVVSYSEPNHVATPEDVINSTKIVNHTIKNSYLAPDMCQDKKVDCRKQELLVDAGDLLKIINGNGDIMDPTYLHSLVTSGFLDAPMLKNNPFAKGNIMTTFVGGSCYAIDGSGKIMMEYERTADIYRTISMAGGILK